MKQNGTEKEKEILEANLRSYEPLPYYDQTLFEEKFGKLRMCLGLFMGFLWMILPFLKYRCRQNENTH